jgi:hypothetical protein
MKETEIEVEEIEVERVYCDECGGECTDDHRIEPSEVCPSCSSETAVERVGNLMRIGEDEGEPKLTDIMLLVVIFPVIVPLILLSAPNKNGPDKTDLKLMLLFIIGSVSWTSLLFYIFVL